MIRIEDIAEDQIIFYDLETTSQYAPYCDITLIGCQQGFNGKYRKIEHYKDQIWFKKQLKDPEILKVGFNCLNFDNILLERYGFPVNEKNCHDGYLMIKTICPKLPSFGLKFLCWRFLGDMHLPEMELEAWTKKNKVDKWLAPNELLEPYLAHDLIQHRDIFRLGWEIVQEPKHWDAYQLDMSQGYVTREMILKGGLHIDKQLNKNKIAILQKQVEDLQDAGRFHSDWRISNLNSSKQLGNFFDEEGFALELSANGDFAVRKSDLLDLRDRHIVGEIAYQIRKINGSLNFFKNYDRALSDTTYSESHSSNWIPTSFSISNARTRRYTSNSQYGLNFQNPDKEAKKVQIVPQGWLGFWQDATGIENVVHIYESEDDRRRKAYESDLNWSEYVWLCNLILGTEKTKDELDSIPSPQVPNWSVYKQFKTAKLALNFGMGVSKFCKTTGVSANVGKHTFDQIHEACPAIHSLQDKVRKLLEKYGYVQDVFGHIYSDTPRMAYKCVAYLIQGCGTGSLPKAQMRANYDTLRDYDNGIPCGHLCVTTHDEVGGRLNLELGSNTIFAILQDFQYNMTKRFSPKFANIPLRSKLYLSRTTAADRIEITNLNKKQIYDICSN